MTDEGQAGEHLENLHCLDLAGRRHTRSTMNPTVGQEDPRA
jgi:hypothetical protein